MPYDLVLPHDTISEIEEFVSQHFDGYEAENAAVDIIDSELARLSEDPTVGILQRRVGPWARRRHVFAVRFERAGARADMAYQDRNSPPQIVVYGFQKAPGVVL